MIGVRSVWIFGLVFEYVDGAVIGVNAERHPNRQDFSIAHELGHFLLNHHDRFHLHVDGGIDPSFDEPVERQANQFAAEILMPAKLVREAYENDSDTSEIAKRFRVSEIALGFRLMNLGLK